MAKSCPYTKAVINVESTNGTLIEVDPERDDNIFELGEKLEYRILYHNHETHVKKPLRGVKVTIKSPSGKITYAETDTKGKVYLESEEIGQYLLGYYDKYEKKSTLVRFDVVKAKQSKPEPEPEPKPKPVCDTSKWDKLIEYYEQLLRALRLKKEKAEEECILADDPYRQG